MDLKLKVTEESADVTHVKAARRAALGAFLQGQALRVTAAGECPISGLVLSSD